MWDLVGNPVDQFSQKEAQMPLKDADRIANNVDPQSPLFAQCYLSKNLETLLHLDRGYSQY